MTSPGESGGGAVYEGGCWRSIGQIFPTKQKNGDLTLLYITLYPALPSCSVKKTKYVRLLLAWHGYGLFTIHLERNQNASLFKNTLVIFYKNTPNRFSLGTILM